MRCSGSRLGCLFLCTVGLLFAPASASAAQRYASAQSDDESGSCSATSPCSLEDAIEDASAGDEIIVAPGTYRLEDDDTLQPTVPVDLHGAAGQPRPHLVGDDDATLLSFKAGGSVRHLALEATGPGQDALVLRGGLAEDLVVRSATGDGAKLRGDPAGTILRDSVVEASGAGPGVAGIGVRDSSAGGDATLLNVTVIATGVTASGVTCELTNGHARLVNAIVRGTIADVEATLAGANCSARSSNFRSLLSPGVIAEPGNQEESPDYVDAAHGDYRPLAGSPTVDAGSDDPLLGSSDPAGCPRMLGGSPDIGAYEYADPALDSCAWAPPEPVLAAPALPTTGDPDIDEAIRGVPAPVLGKTVVVNPGSGTLLLRRPGSRRFKLLDEPARVPVGSVVDARRGRAGLITSVAAAGRLQAGTFWGSRFEVRQPRGGRGMTSLILRGGNFARCRRPAASRRSGISANASYIRRDPVRRLWGRDSGGRYRTFGRHSQATVRGTRWLTADRCDGTLTRVTAGAVAVRDRGRHRTVMVRAGHSYLARSR